MASFTVTVNGTEPAAVGVPLKTHMVLYVRVEGNPVALQVNGDVPPLAVSACEYATPTVAFGSVVFVIVNVAPMVIV